jgi:hypothetical protein
MSIDAASMFIGVLFGVIVGVGLLTIIAIRYGGK